MKPDQIHEGLTWRDMPGSDNFDKRMSFVLFRLGKITKAYVLATPLERARMNSSGTCIALRRRKPKSIHPQS